MGRGLWAKAGGIRTTRGIRYPPSAESRRTARESPNKPPAPPAEDSVPAPVLGGRLGSVLSLPLVRKHPNAPGGKTPPPPFPKQGAGGCAPTGGTACPPQFRAKVSPVSQRRVQGTQCSAGRCRGSPPVLENVGGWSGRDSGAGQARPSSEGGRRPQQARPPPISAPRLGGSLCHTPLVKSERVCYSTPMKSAPGPLLFLGACRIKYVLGANHGESPCGRGAEGTTQGARPSEEGWDRSNCRCMAQAPWSHPAQRRMRDGCATASDGSATAKRRLRACKPRIRLKNLTTYNQRP